MTPFRPILVHHWEEMRSLRSRLPRYGLFIVVVTGILFILFTIATFQFLHMSFCGHRMTDFPSSTALLDYMSIRFHYAMTRLPLFTIGAFLTLGWALLSWLVWFLTCFILDLLLGLFFWPDPGHQARHFRYNRFLERRLRRQRFVLVTCIFLAAAAELILLRVWARETFQVIDIFVLTVLFVVPLVYAFFWAHYLALFFRHSKRYPHGFASFKRYTHFLFSTESLRRRFRGTCCIVGFLALLGWVLIPSLLNAINGLAEFLFGAALNRPGYDLLVQRLVADDSAMKHLRDAGMWVPVPSSDILADLNIFRHIVKVHSPLDVLRHFMMRMFLVVSVSGFLEVSIPILVKATLARQYRRGVRVCLMNSARAAVLVIGLQWITSHLYFVQPTDWRNAAAWFFLFLGFFFAHDTELQWSDDRIGELWKERAEPSAPGDVAPRAAPEP